ncbi:MAG: cell division protein FtsZ [Patescibacteria group bacterium]|nr:cell division protein FtsZ [Patescibacteria group bacterium]
MPQLQIEEPQSLAVIKVFGVGGAGGAAINRMKDSGLNGVTYVAVNTDAQALAHSSADEKIHIGQNTTRGLGAGADPAVGKAAAEESKEDIKRSLEGADMIFIAAGKGGGTGSGAAGVVASIAREMDILVLGVVTKPFSFEGDRRRRNAEWGIAQLEPFVDTLITIPNDKLLQTIERDTPLVEAFKFADDVLRQGVQGITDLITEAGLINLDFADIKTIVSRAGSALMGIGRATGENRAVNAAQQAIESPLLEVSIDGARGVLFSVAGGQDLSMHEINEAAEVITSAVAPDANIIFGASIRDDLEEGEVVVTVVATGFDPSYFHSRPNSNSLGDFEPDSLSSSRVTASKKHILDDEDNIERVKEEIGDIGEDLDKDKSTSDNEKSITDKDDDDDRDVSVWDSEDDDDDDEDEDDTPSFLRRRLRRK